MNMPVIPTLHQNAMLAYLTIGCWSARKLDRKASGKVTKDAGASDDAARVNKYLLANADSLLKEIQSVAGKARRYLESNTLPWDDAGNRLLSNAKGLQVITEMAALELEFNALVDQFVQEYPLLRAEAIRSLGDLAAAEDYPQPDVVRQKFSMRLSLSPLPTGFGDVRTDLQQEQVSALQAHFEANVRAQTNRALMSAWQRLREDVAKFVDRLEPNPDGTRKVFRDSMVENTRDTCALLASLNVFGDPDLDAIRREVEYSLCAFTADQLRSSTAASEGVLKSATDIFARINNLLGE